MILFNEQIMLLLKVLISRQKTFYTIKAIFEMRQICSYKYTEKSSLKFPLRYNVNANV